MMWIFIALFALIGLWVGSWVGTISLRIANKRSLRGTSICQTCLDPIAVADMVPILGYVRLRGRCRNCASVISWQYPVIEIVISIVFAILATRTVMMTDIWFQIPRELIGGLLVRDMVAVVFLIMLFVYDARQFIVPDRISIPAIIFIAFMNMALGIPLLDWVIGGVIGGLFFGIQYLVSNGHLVGAGDIRAGILVGVILGFPGVLESIIGAYILACIVFIPLFFMKRVKPMDKAPFVSFLALSTIILLCAGPILHESFLSMFNLIN